jgi:hypothetical protein
MDPYDLLLMQRIDEQYTRMPFYGSRKMTAFLRRGGHRVNRKRVRGLMRQMGLEAIYPRPRLSQAHPEHEIYPYLLREVTLDCVFRRIPATDSDPFRPGIPIDSGHPFRSIPATPPMGEMRAALDN